MPARKGGLLAAVRILLPESEEVMKARMLSPMVYSAESASISVKGPSMLRLVKVKLDIVPTS